MNTLSQLKQLIIKTSGQALEITYPPDAQMGDLSIACFNLAKTLGKAPHEVAADLENKLQGLGQISEMKIMGPYLNIFVNKEYLAIKILSEIKTAKNNYGKNQNGKNQGVMIEFSNANTHKEYHIGHLRNIFFGDAINKILDANGHKAIPVSYINDFGIHVAKTLWAYLKFHKKDKLKNPGMELGKIYTEAAQKSKEDEIAQKEISEIMKAIESRKGSTYKLWQTSRLWSLKYFSEIYKKLNIKFKKTFYESAVIAAGLDLVEKLTKKKILVKSEGAIIANLENYNLGVLPIIRSDGTALYPVADLALATIKFKNFNLKESIYIVDTRQSLYFKQLFKIVELMGYKQKMTHLAYDFVTLPSGMMSSRTGNVITYQELYDEAVKKAMTETTKRHDDWKKNKITATAETLALAALKFEMLKVAPDKVISFNIDEALKFEGYTATYLIYSYARIMSIFRKDKKASATKISYKLLSNPTEADLILKLAKYPEAIIKAKDNYNPSEIAKYLFELTKMFNDYYHNIPILKAEKDLKNARLALIGAVGQIIKNGLELLGIKTINEI